MIDDTPGLDIGQRLQGQPTAFFFLPIQATTPVQ